MPPFAKTIGLILLAIDPIGGVAHSPQAGPGPVSYERRFASPPAMGASQTRLDSQAAPLPGSPRAVSAGLVGAGQRRALPAPTPDSSTRPPTRLPPPGNAGRPAGDRAASGLPSVVTVASSLAIVLGVFLLLAWGMRRAAPAGTLALPGEVFEVLGSASMASRQQAHLLRCGRKLVLVSVTTAGAETITEITDPEEVDRLAGLCRQAHPQSTTATFRQVFKQFAQRNQPPDFLNHPHRNARLTEPDMAAGPDRREAHDA